MPRISSPIKSWYSWKLLKLVMLNRKNTNIQNCYKYHSIIYLSEIYKSIYQVRNLISWTQILNFASVYLNIFPLDINTKYIFHIEKKIYMISGILLACIEGNMRNIHMKFSFQWFWVVSDEQIFKQFFHRVLCKLCHMLLGQPEFPNQSGLDNNVCLLVWYQLNKLVIKVTSVGHFSDRTSDKIIWNI